ncbi:MAG: MotA/TolQ/ExbB proton channel family protein [Lachnospiraceae bacterium]|nr:MotA/TolQ/ExbB proton channel family protein [Lachnospiraceae bacterium]
MKNKLYYVLFLFYALVVAFVLYINGVFAGEEPDFVTMLINIGFLIIIGVLFVISTVSFGRLNRCTDELVAMTEQLSKEYKASGGKNLWASIQERKDVFTNSELRIAFHKYRARIKSYRTKRGLVGTCELEEYINEDLLDRVGMSFFNSGISGTLTGLGILGTFLGLSIGLGSFSGNDIYTISDNVGPLLSGMKVAFHTSVYGIFFSLIFNFVYRSIMADAYEKLEEFLNAFKQFAQPIAATEDENSAAMLVYQANMANAMKQMLDLMKGNAMEQTAGVERIANQFVEKMNGVLGVQFQKLGNNLKSAGDVQMTYANSSKDLIEAATALVEVNRNMQEVLKQMLQRQEGFAKELQEQKEKLNVTCDEISDEISNQLYAFDQMRSLYEK